MNFLFIFRPNLIEWRLEVMRRLRDGLPDARFCAYLTKGEGGDALARLRASELVSDVFDQTRAEAGWLAAPGDAERLRRWDERLGPGGLNRIFLSDRHLVRSLVDSELPATPLSRAAQSRERLGAYLASMLSELDAYLERHAIDCVFAPFGTGAPIITLAELCRVKHVRFLRLTNTRVGRRYVVDEGAEGGLATVEARYREALANPERLAATVPAARAFLRDFRARPKEAEYLKESRAAAVGEASLRKLIRRTVKLPASLARAGRTVDVRTPHAVERWKVELRQLWRSRRRAQRAVRAPEREVSGRFAYFPLHVEPEPSTMVMAPTLPNQAALIETLARSLPVDMTLLVKEHPTMTARRPGAFYRRIARLPRCRFLDPAVPGVSVCAKAALTCTVSGTAAWEAMLLGRPALVFGTFPFAVFGQGLVQCTDFGRLPEAIAQALGMSPVPDRDLELYLAAVFELGFDFPPALFWRRRKQPPASETSATAEAIAAGILRVLAGERPARGAHASSTAVTAG